MEECMHQDRVTHQSSAAAILALVVRSCCGLDRNLWIFKNAKAASDSSFFLSWKHVVILCFPWVIISHHHHIPLYYRCLLRFVPLALNDDDNDNFLLFYRLGWHVASVSSIGECTASLGKWLQLTAQFSIMTSYLDESSYGLARLSTVGNKD